MEMSLNPADGRILMNGERERSEFHLSFHCLRIEAEEMKRKEKSYEIFQQYTSGEEIYV